MNKIKWSDLCNESKCSIDIPVEAYKYNGSTDECCERYWDGLSVEDQLGKLQQILDGYKNIVKEIQSNIDAVTYKKCLWCDKSCYDENYPEYDICASCARNR